MAAEIQRNNRTAIPIIIIFAIVIAGFYYFSGYTGFKLFIAALLVSPLFYITYLIVSYKGPKKSKLYGIEGLTAKLPAVKKAKGHVEFKYKLMWTAIVVILYFALTNIYIYGLNASQTIDVFASFRAGSLAVSPSMP